MAHCTYKLPAVMAAWLLLGMSVLSPSTAVGVTSESAAQDHDAYAIEKIHIKFKTSSCIPGFLYKPSQPLTQPPGAVVMVPAWGQNALHATGLHDYAQTFASYGLAVVVLSAPGSLLTNSNDTKEKQFLLHCGQQHHQQQQLPSGVMQQPSGLFGDSSSSSYRNAVVAYIKQLADEGRVDSSRIAVWGAEWGAVAAVQLALDAAELEVQTLLLQTPLLTATRAQNWQKLKAKGWRHVIKSLTLSTVHWLSRIVSGLLNIPESFRLLGSPLSGPPGSGALLELQQDELELHSLALSAEPELFSALPQPNTRTIPQSALLDLLIHGNPIRHLSPKLTIPVAFYAAAGDSDTPAYEYVSVSKTARYVSFHMSPGSRYTLLAGREEDRKVLEEVIWDQTMLLIALLGDVNLVHSMSAAKGQQQQQQELDQAQQQQQHSGTTEQNLETSPLEREPNDAVSLLQQPADPAVPSSEQHADSKQCLSELAASCVSQM